MSTRVRIIPDILEQHFDELEFLWGQRREALRSHEYTRSAFLELERRIGAHVKGLLVGGEAAVPLLATHLAEDDPNVVFAAAYPLLRMRHPDAVEAVRGAMTAAEGASLGGFGDALSHVALDPLLADLLTGLLDDDDPTRAATAAEVLAFHGKLDPRDTRVAAFAGHEDAGVRIAAWRIVMTLGAMPPGATADDALVLEEAVVRDAALTALVWVRHPAARTLLRGIAKAPAPADVDALALDAALAPAADMQRVLESAADVALGPRRFDVLGAFGFRDAVPPILTALADPDPATAVAAGTAFTRITGRDITSNERVPVAPEDGTEPDEFEAEFLDIVNLPDRAEAVNIWNEIDAGWEPGVRRAGGVALVDDASDDILAQIDMRARWEARLRGRLAGAWQGHLRSHVSFPQPAG